MLLSLPLLAWALFWLLSYCLCADSTNNKIYLIKYTHNPSCVLERSGHFEKGVAEGAVDPSFNPIMALRLSVLKDSAVWAILSEVSPPNGSPHCSLSSHMINTANKYHVMLCFLPADTYKEDSWLSRLEGAHDSWPRGTKIS